MGTRRKARELVLQACYAFEFSGNPQLQVLEAIILSSGEKPIVVTFAASLYRKATDHAEEVDSMIKKWAANWEFSRIAIIDRILLRMAICEFMHFEDIPPKVSIDEAIEIAKLYSTENSGRFINGLLDAILAHLEKQGTLKKAGRGLNDGQHK